MYSTLLEKLWLSNKLQQVAGPLALAFIVLLFLLDLAIPLGYSYALFHVFAILLSFFSRGPGWVKLATAGSIAATLLAWLISPLPDQVPPPLVTFNRLVTVLVCLLAGLAALEFYKVVSRMRSIHEELQHTSGMLHIASRAGKLGGWYVELDSGQIKWTDETARIHGYPPGQIPDLEAAFNHYPPDYQGVIRQAFEDCAREGTGFDLELQLTTLHGERRWVRSIGHAVKNRNGQIVRVHGAFQDIQESHNARLELARSAERWNQLAEAMPMIVWTASADGEVDFFSKYLERFVDRPIVELLGAGWLECLHPEDRSRVVEVWATHLQSREPYEAEFRVQKASGEYEWHLGQANFVMENSSHGKWYGSAINIHKLKTLQQQADRLIDRLSNTMESVTDAIFSIDKAWRFIYLNHHAEELLLRSREELVGKVIWDEFPEAVGDIFEEQYRHCMSEQEPVRFEAYFDPLETLFEVNAYPSDEGITVYFRDVTTQRRLADHLQQVQRLESLGQLTGGVAHDFNNLLTVILGNAEMLSESLDDNPGLQKMAEGIGGAAQRAAEMTRRLLAFARKQALEPQPADLNRLVIDIEPLLQRSLGDDIEIEIIQSAGLWSALVDTGRLESVLVNLAVNARDAMPDGGKLTIETSNTRLDENYTDQQPDLQPGQYVLLAVTDSGQGIPAHMIKKVFEPFFTTKSNDKGTGLGLAMAYGFIKQSNGHITVYSEQGAGSTFKIYLPRHHGTDAEGEARKSRPQETNGQGELILLVEDNLMVQNFAKGQLLELGYRVLSASSGMEALDLLREYPDIDLLFTDVVMPGGMSGRQLADEALAIRPDLPVLYSSGYTENAIVHHGRLEPGVLLLAKPYRRADLAAKVKQALSSTTDAHEREE